MKLRQRAVRIAVVTFAAFAGAAGVAFATQALSNTAVSTTQINACQQKQVGLLRIVASSADCLKSEIPISWNAEGVKGDPGAAGHDGVSVTSSQLPVGSVDCAYGGASFASASPFRTFACTGAPGSDGRAGVDGTDGADGKSVTLADAGAACSDGGIAVSAGGDTRYVCNGAAGAPGAPGTPGAGLVSFNDLEGKACTAGSSTGTIVLAFNSSGVATIACHFTSSNGCSLPAPTVPNGTAVCSSGVYVTNCNAGFGDLDGNTANGCEVNFMTDPANCGAPNMVVSFPNAVSLCVNGVGVLGPCNPGFYNVDGSPANGCESTTPPLPLDGMNNTFSTAGNFTSNVSCGGLVDRTGTTYPAGTEDWFVVNPNGAPCASGPFKLTLTAGTDIVFDVVRPGGFPPANAVDADLQGSHQFSGTGSFTIRVHGRFGTTTGNWTLRATNGF